MTSALFRAVRSAVLVAAGITLAACGADDKQKARMEAAIDSVSRTDTVAAGGEVANATAPAMSEGSLVSVLAATNGAEIAGAELAKARSTNKDVKELADDFADDHKDFQKKVDDAAKDAQITPQSSPGADSLKLASQQAMDSLKTLSGVAFDRAWTAHVVAEHQKTLSSLQALQGSAHDEDLREAISDGIKTVEDHLKKAQDLQAKLAGTAR